MQSSLLLRWPPLYAERARQRPTRQLSLVVLSRPKRQWRRANDCGLRFLWHRSDIKHATGWFGIPTRFLVAGGVHCQQFILWLGVVDASRRRSRPRSPSMCWRPGSPNPSQPIEFQHLIARLHRAPRRLDHLHRRFWSAGPGPAITLGSGQFSERVGSLNYRPR